MKKPYIVAKRLGPRPVQITLRESTRTDMQSLPDSRACAHPNPEFPLSSRSKQLPSAHLDAQEGSREAPGCAPVGGVLGTYAKTSAALANSDSEQSVRWFPVDDGDGEVKPFEMRGMKWVEHKKLAQIRCDRYRLKSAVNRLLIGSRTSKCCRWKVPTQSVQVMHSAEHSKAFYAGLQVCASVWLCPVCAPKISERRRVELRAAMDEAQRQGLDVMLMTLTVPHGLGDDLDAMLDKMMKAYADTSSNRAGKTARKSVGLRGTVRVLEVTHGRHGWHPHFHVLLFLESGMLPDQVKTILAPTWQNACEKRGLPRPSDEHGVDVRGGYEAAAYVSKWGLEHEMTKGHLKASRSAKGASPWALLAEYQETRSKRSAALWMAYAGAFKGRRQLCWSKGLRDLLAVVEMDDAEIVAKEDTTAVVLAELTDDQWRDVLTTQNEASLLQVAEENPSEVQAFLDGVALLAKVMGAPSPSIGKAKPGARLTKES